MSNKRYKNISDGHERGTYGKFHFTEEKKKYFM